MPEDDRKEVDSEYKLRFSLTERQKDISSKLLLAVNDNKNVLLEAVCGAGKTEIVFETISSQLAQKKKVGFAIPRRQVVLELAERLKQAFTNLKVVAVCQGYTKDVMGDLIVCTTHQLYRYNNYFDLLIIDEPDAFPFKNNEVLKGIAKNSCKGVIVYLTATPDEYLKQMVENGQLVNLYLSKRPTGKPLCVPKVVYGFGIIIVLQLFYYLIKLFKMRQPIILFVPSKKIGTMFYMALKPFIKVCYINSSTENKDEIIGDFKENKYSLCISTTVLERGITIARVNIIVYKADNGVFDEASLTQMAGRVGRSKDYPYGECIFLTSSKSEIIDGCINSIERANND